AGQEKIRAASDRREGRQTGDPLADRTPRDFEFQRAVLMADDRVAFIAELVKTPIVDPDILRELELADEARADHERRDTALLAIFGRAFREGCTVGGAASNHAAAVHVLPGVTRIHPPDVRAERHGITQRVLLL